MSSTGLKHPHQYHNSRKELTLKIIAFTRSVNCNGVYDDDIYTHPLGCVYIYHHYYAIHHNNKIINNINILYKYLTNAFYFLTSLTY